MATGSTSENSVLENLDRDIMTFMTKKMGKEYYNFQQVFNVHIQIDEGIMSSLCNVILKPFSQLANEAFMSLYSNSLVELQAAHISWTDIKLRKGHHLLSRADKYIQQNFPDVCQIKASNGVRFIGKGKDSTSARDAFLKIVKSQQTSSQSLKRALSQGDDAAPKYLKLEARNENEGDSSKSSEEDKSKKVDDSEDMCSICLSDFTGKYTLPSCKHAFCRKCIDMASRIRPVCPLCSKPYGTVFGNQPKNADMTFSTIPGHVPGYPLCDTIEITYSIPNGIQGPEHPQPGNPFHGTMRIAYLPNNAEGKHVLQLLQRAFKQRLIFTVGVSRTTGVDNIVTWNDIHHKTSIHGGPLNYGYPDPEYLKRVQDELKDKGIE